MHTKNVPVNNSSTKVCISSVAVMLINPPAALPLAPHVLEVAVPHVLHSIHVDVGIPVHTVPYLRTNERTNVHVRTYVRTQKKTKLHVSGCNIRKYFLEID